ncbi:MAG: hypothetical protein D6733_07550 [Methanobacteriota archaeon]|nr:MAG: hypothetical protein D6733_07550 [Euryarchaeota archaeon]
MRQDYIYMGMFLIIFGVYTCFVYLPVPWNQTSPERLSIAKVHSLCATNPAALSGLIRSCTTYEAAYIALLLTIGAGAVIFIQGSLKPSIHEERRRARENSRKDRA